MNPHIFRKYDIRGIAATDLTDELVFNLGRAFATFASKKLDGVSVGVGYDMRTSSPRLFEQLSNGLRAAGANVVDLGMVPTPLVYFAKYTRDDVNACVQITGSHNPGDYNGFKMMVGGDTLHGDDIQDLKTIIEDETYIEGDGALSKVDDLIDAYLAYVDENITMGSRKLKIVVDCGNGVAGVCAQAFLEQLGCETIGMYMEPDGTFPNHHPDPTVPENLKDLSAAVKEHGADLGVAYDGDGDRIGCVDENGEIIFGDMLVVILSRAMLKAVPGATIIGEVKCSQNLFDDIESRGGKAIMSKVGHSLIKAKIKETNAELAGEMSGHIFYNQRWFGFDDALYTTARLLEIVSASDAPISSLLEGIPKTYATPELRVDCSDATKFDIPGKIAAKFSDRYATNTIDGVRINFGDGWGLCRASNTQPALVLRVEAETADRRDEYLGWIKEAITEASV